MSCPMCEKETDEKWRPFCSQRCADIDLGRWMIGAYRVASEEDETPEVEPENKLIN